MDHRRVPGHRPLCVPVRRPPYLTMLGHLAVAAGGACAALGAWWQAGPAGTAALAAAAAGVAGWRRVSRRAAASPVRPVRAVRAMAGSRAWQLRMGRRWHGAVLYDTRRGACWLELRLQLDSIHGAPVTGHRVAVWRSTVSQARWRRLCLLAGAAQRLNAPDPRAP